MNEYISSLPTYNIVISKEKFKTWFPLIMGTLYTLYGWWDYLNFGYRCFGLYRYSLTQGTLS